MRSHSLTIIDDYGHPLLPANAGKNATSRLQPYIDWLQETGQSWYSPNLMAYAQFLRDRGLAETSIASHCFTIRSRYRNIMKTNSFRDLLFNAAAAEADGFAETKLMVDEKLARMENDLEEVKIERTVYQDREAHIHLTEGQVEDFLGQLQSVRDVALFKLMLSTALRAFEVTALDVPDIFQQYSDEDAVEVRHGKGNKQRMVPWGNFRPWCMPAITDWLAFSGITAGPLFRGLWKNGLPRPNRMNPSSLNFILESFPITHAGQHYTITPHDLRYTYARWAYLSGMPVHAIQANLGHASLQTTWIYIGQITAKERAPDWVYQNQETL